MGEGSITFMQGSLAFTGNLNLYMAQLASGGSVVAADSFDPRLWKRMIEAEQGDLRLSDSCQDAGAAAYL